jgi:hypothetical protein
VVRTLNASIERELETDVTGLPWSLHSYVERRLLFAPDQEAEEKFVTILCRLHTLHLAGPDQWWRIGATIAQAFKALEHVIRERDWQLAWCWLDLPDPRPGMARGLAHPAEHSAAVAFLREAHLLEAQCQAVAGSWVAWPSAAEPRECPEARRPQGQPQPAAGQPAVISQHTNAQYDQGQQARRRRPPKGAGKGAAAGAVGTWRHTTALPAHWVPTGRRLQKGPTFRSTHFTEQLQADLGPG